MKWQAVQNYVQLICNKWYLWILIMHRRIVEQTNNLYQQMLIPRHNFDHYFIFQGKTIKFNNLVFLFHFLIEQKLKSFPKNKTTYFLPHKISQIPSY